MVQQRGGTVRGAGRRTGCRTDQRCWQGAGRQLELVVAMTAVALRGAKSLRFAGIPEKVNVLIYGNQRRPQCRSAHR